MAKITLKCFGVFGLISDFEKGPVEAKTLADLIDFLNDCNKEKEKITFNKTLVYVNGLHRPKPNTLLNDGDEVWLLSPFTGEKKEKPKKEKADKSKKDGAKPDQKSA